MSKQDVGFVTRVSGAVIHAQGFKNLRKNLLVQIGPEKIIGEVIQIEKDESIIQAYEETTGLQLGTEIINTETPYRAQLGPDLLGKVFDGLQRPLNSSDLRNVSFLKRGTFVSPIQLSKKILFTPSKVVGDLASPGEQIGFCYENSLIHPILYPSNQTKGVIAFIAKSGNYTLDETSFTLTDNRSFSFIQNWEIRKPRPNITRLDNDSLFLTGQRVLDTFFPIPLGGTATISGGFGTGKTILEQTIAKNAKIDVVILVLIGERGNEVATVLNEFSQLKDSSGKPLMERTVVIVNTSNMPVAAREASIYLGITIAEYYRDLGLHVCLLADSISRWAEASREISSRLEEMPGEEGYPSYMSKQLGEFIERAGYFRTRNDNEGSITFIAAVSPPGGDFTEPVTQAALQITGAFWALNTNLARSRHYPAVDWRISYSLYSSTIGRKVNQTFTDWLNTRNKLLEIMKSEEELERNVRLLGKESLSEHQKGYLDMSKLIKNSFLQQNAFDDIDMFCSFEKQNSMLMVLNYIWDLFLISNKQGITSDKFFDRDEIQKYYRMNEIPNSEIKYFTEEILYLKHKIDTLSDKTKVFTS